jgi:hypothetical protein
LSGVFGTTYAIKPTMCGWMLAKMVMSRPTTHVEYRWQSDFSRLPFPKRRAYGRIVNDTFQCNSGSIRRLKSSSIADLYALSLKDDRGALIIVYFTRLVGDPLERFEYRHRPSEIRKRGEVPIGITSIQYSLGANSQSGTQYKVFQEAFSARLFLGSTSSKTVTGSIVAVFPDQQRSFVSGSFKARLIDLSLG